MSSEKLKNKEHSNLGKAYLCGVLFALIVGFSFMSVKVCVNITTPLYTLVFRYNFALLAAIVAAIALKRRPTTRGKDKKNLLLTASFYIAFMIIQAVGLVYATSIESGIFFAVIPVVAKIIASIFLGEKSGWKQNAFMCLSVASLIGMIVCGATTITMNLVGAAILLISSFCLAISNVFMRYVRNQYTPAEIGFAIALGGCLLCNIAVIILGLRDGTISEYAELLFNKKFMFATIYLGIPSTYISSLLVSYASRNLEAVKATIFGNLSSAISIVAGALLMGEPLYWYHIIFSALIITGVIGVSASGMKTE